MKLPNWSRSPAYTWDILTVDAKNWIKKDLHAAATGYI